MVQSISSTGKTSASVELKTQNEQTSTSNSTDIEQEKSDFSKILEDNSEPAMEAKATTDDASAGTLVDEEQSLEGVDDVLSLDEQDSLLDIELNIEASDNELTELSDVAEANTDVELISFDDVAYDGESIDTRSSDIDNDNSQQSQLLSSIQSAQKANTTVNNVTEDGQDIAQVSNKNVTLETANVTGKTVQGLVDNISMENSTENIDAKTAADAKLSSQFSTNKVTEGVIEGLGSETVASEKTDDLEVLFKSEKASFNQAFVDVNGAKPIQTNAVQTDKLVAINQQTQTTNNLLEEPLDIQSKQAASMIGERVMMMISQGKQEVQIRLDPAELGSMFIKVNMQQDEVQLNIQTQASVTKDIIDQNMPRLREQLAQQGIQLGDANVEQQAQQQRQQQNNEINATGSQANNGLDHVNESETAQWIPSSIASSEQGIDYYA
jgi:flagellar hook-length control protein FliK